jgi:antigen flippase
MASSFELVPISVSESSKLPAERKTTERGSYGQILTSSAVVGGSAALKIAIGIVRTKALAVLLGPAGFGLFGLFGSVADLSQNIAGMGVNSSGVRQIAEAVGSSDNELIAKTVAVLRRTSIVLGLIGAALVASFSRQISRLTFGSTSRASAIALLSFAVFFTLVSGGQGAAIQGTRRIADLAKMNVLGALFGLCTSVPLVFFFREKGVVPSLVAVAATTILTSWWYSRKIRIPVINISLSEVRAEAAALLKLGSAFMASGLMTMGAAYFTRVILLQKVGFEATGLYQSSWTLGGLYVGFVLQAMTADFYPRLTASANNHEECNRLVNEQILIGLLLAGPGVLATITLAPFVVTTFYSAGFGAAVPVLRWICIGVLLQVITWPMGFIIVAKGKSSIFFLAELAWTLAAVTLAWCGIKMFGLTGAGVAFFASYVFHILLIYPIVGRLTHYRLSTEVKRICVLLFISITCISLSLHAFVGPKALVIGSLVTIAAMSYSLRTIIRLVPLDDLPPFLRSLMRSWYFDRISRFRD